MVAGRRCARVLAALLATLALVGCASLPDVARAPSVARPVEQGSRLAAAAQAPAGSVGQSGFRLIHTGSTALDARMELVGRAERSIDAQYYHVGADVTGRRFLRGLRDAAERGVRVRLLVDDLYTDGLDDLLLGLDAHAHVEVRLFNPFVARGGMLQRFVAAPHDIARLQRRMHNKLLVVDGALAIAGGRNMADEYFGQTASQVFFDFDVLVAGAVVPQLAAVFDAYWNSLRVFPVGAIVPADGDAERSSRAFVAATGGDAGFMPLPLPPIDFLGARPVREDLDAGRLRLTWAVAEAVADSPDKIVGVEAPIGLPPETDFKQLREYITTRMVQARSELVIVGPYNIPGEAGVRRMKAAVANGVRIQMLTNSLLSTDEPLVYDAYQRYRLEMLRGGIELYEFSATLGRGLVREIERGDPVLRMHTKCVVFDRSSMFIGSLNFDPRSRDHNTEVGLLIQSPALAGDTLRLIEVLRREAAYRVALAADGAGVEWRKTNADGSESIIEPPRLGLWQRLKLELLSRFVPEGML